MKYGLILLIIGLIQLGWATFEPPTPTPRLFNSREYNPKGFGGGGVAAAAAAATMALLGSDRSEGVKVNAEAAPRSGRTCRAMQAVFFLHKREGDISVS